MVESFRYKKINNDIESDIQNLQTPCRRRQRWTEVALVFFACLSILLGGYVWMFERPSDLECARQTSIWSPALEAVEYEEVDFENYFDHKSVYRGPPSLELEESWNDITHFEKNARIPEDKLPLLNRTEYSTEGLPLLRFDDGGYPAYIEVFHQLHCLNIIRQYTWYDWYKSHEDVVPLPKSLKDDLVGIRMHVDHCIETLRLTLMCHGDVTPSIIIKDSTEDLGLRADFNMHQKCRNFGKLRQWMIDQPHSIQKFIKVKNPEKPYHGGSDLGS